MSNIPQPGNSAHWRQLAMPIACLIAGMISVQSGTSLAKGLFAALGSGGTAMLRIIFAAMMMAILFQPWKIRLRRDNWLPLFCYGMALGAMNISFYKSLETVPLGIAVAIEFIGPLGVVIISSRRNVDFLWAVLAISGLLMLVPWGEESHNIDITGAAYALLAGLFWAIYIIAGKRAGQDHGSRSAAFGMIIAAIIALPVGLAQSGAALFNVALLPIALAVALLSSALPYSLEMVALPRLPSVTFGTLLSLSPAIAALAGYLWLDEHLPPEHWAAIAAIMAASAGATLTAIRSRPS